MKILLLDIAWLAGLLEGEGSFCWHKTSKYKGSIKITMQMADKDIMEKAASILNTKLYGPYISKQKKLDGTAKKETYVLNIFGSNAASWMMTLYSFMGERRKKKIEELLIGWKQQSVIKAGRNALCHPDQPRHAKDKCIVCYNKEYHANSSLRY